MMGVLLYLDRDKKKHRVIAYHRLNGENLKRGPPQTVFE